MSDRVTVTAEQLVAEYGWPESTAALFVPGGETRTFPRVFVEKPPDGEWVRASGQLIVARDRSVFR